MIEFKEKDGALICKVRVVPRASKSEIIGAHNGALKIRIVAPPIDGAANMELIRVLAKFFDAPKSSISILNGDTTKLKAISLTGCDKKRFLEFMDSIQ